jgi:peroxiredoxin
MKKLLATLLLAGAAIALPANAALVVGAKAPVFSAPASLAGKEVQFSMADALRRGPVVLYFYPAAFTPGCTIEANAFSEATDKFATMNATVIGVSADNLDTLHRFSVEACRNKFAVAADPQAAVMKSYEAENTQRPGRAMRISYVIAPDGTVLLAHAGQDPMQHVQMTMAAVEKWKAEHP